jgi:hypothetical protein
MLPGLQDTSAVGTSTELGIATLLKAYVADNYDVNGTEVLDLAVRTAIRKGTNGYPDSAECCPDRSTDRGIVTMLETDVLVGRGTGVQVDAHSYNVNEFDGTLIARRFQGFLEDMSDLTESVSIILSSFSLLDSGRNDRDGCEISAENGDCVNILGN